MSDYPEKVFLNGEIVNYQDAKISVFDRGFLFGDGIYEVMAKINGSFFYGDAHLERLSSCLEKINIDFDTTTISDHIRTLLIASDLLDKDCLLYIQVTRGVAPRKHNFPDRVLPTLMIYAKPFVLPDINQKHVAVVSMTDYRWHRCDLKMTSLLGNVMASDHAIREGAFEAVFVRYGVITEASHCNVFFVKGNIVFTHPANDLILGGITRQIVIELCNELGIEVKEEAVHAENVKHMDEAFLTGTTTQITSIRQFDDHHFYERDLRGQVTNRLQHAFLELKNKKG